MKNAIITGATGGVGVSLINELLSHGVSIAAVCRPGSSRLGNIPSHPSVSITECPLSSLGELPQMLTGSYDAFFHLAWDGTFGAERNDYTKQLDNIAYTLEAVRAAKSLGCSVFVGAGSQSEFGHVEGALSPSLPCSPDNGYGAAKLSAGAMSRALCGALGIRHVWCRILSMFGPYDSERSLIKGTLLRMLNGERVSFTKGDQIWDYIYCEDVARAFYASAERGRDGAIYCIGSGKTRRLRDFITVMRDTVDPSLPIGLGEIDYYPNQVMYLEADITTLTRDTGFVPAVSFEEGIGKIIAVLKQS